MCGLKEEEKGNGWRTWGQVDGGWEAKEIDLARRSFPSKRRGQVSTIRKEWIRGMALKTKLSGGVL